MWGFHWHSLINDSVPLHTSCYWRSVDNVWNWVSFIPQYVTPGSFHHENSVWAVPNRTEQPIWSWGSNRLRHSSTEIKLLPQWSEVPEALLWWSGGIKPLTVEGKPICRWKHCKCLIERESRFSTPNITEMRVLGWVKQIRFKGWQTETVSRCQYPVTWHRKSLKKTAANWLLQNNQPGPDSQI